MPSMNNRNRRTIRPKALRPATATPTLLAFSGIALVVLVGVVSFLAIDFPATQSGRATNGATGRPPVTSPHPAASGPATAPTPPPSSTAGAAKRTPLPKDAAYYERSSNPPTPPGTIVVTSTAPPPAAPTAAPTQPTTTTTTFTFVFPVPTDDGSGYDDGGGDGYDHRGGGHH